MKFIDIYECIIKYYPLGISELAPVYQEYSGTKLLQELCHNKINPVKSNEWEKLISDLKVSFPEIISFNDETEIIEPSYSCSLTFYKSKKDNITHIKQIKLHVSVLGPFYTVYGLDIIQIGDTIDNVIMETEPILSVSPIEVYEDIIPIIQNIIMKSYPSFKYVSFYYLRKRIKALSVAGAEIIDNADASIFQALFTNENLTKYRLKGDVYYE